MDHKGYYAKICENLGQLLEICVCLKMPWKFYFAFTHHRKEIIIFSLVLSNLVPEQIHSKL